MKPVASFLAMSAVILLLWTGCSKKKLPPPTTAVYSVNGGTTSHNNGQLCMSCHKTGGTGEYIWVIAGSVYNEDQTTPSSNGVIYFWTGLGGTGELIASLQIDANGNFFTTSSLIPALGAYLQVRGISGATKTMSTLVFTGNCNSCHGVNEAPIWIN